MTRTKSAKAKTPSGRGHGFTDDAQKYERLAPTDAERLANVRSAAQVAGSMIRIWGTGTEAQQAAMAALELVEREAMG
jgi:hypothetical protein